MRHRASLVLGLVGLLWLPLECAGAFELGEPYFESVGDAESIPDNNVNALAEDQSGFLWIGTPAGLLRYDGYRFQRFGSDDAHKFQVLGGAVINALLVARDGRLWIGTEADGLWVHDPTSGHATQFRHDPDDTGSLGHDIIRSLAQDAQGAIWIGTRGGLDYLPAQASRFTHYRHRPDDASSLNDDRVVALWVDGRGDLWVGSWNGLNRMRAGTAVFEPVHSDPVRAESLANKGVVQLFEAADGRFWIGVADGSVFILDPATLRMERIDDEPGRASRGRGLIRFAQPIEHEVWMGRSGGIDVLMASSGRLLRSMRHDPALQHGLAGSEIHALLRDRSGQLWIGGFGFGLQRVDPRRGGPNVLRFAPARPNALTAPSIGSVVELDNGEIWVGTHGNGVDILDRERGVVGGLRPGPAAPDTLRHGWIRALASCADGDVWIGAGASLVRVDPRTRKLREYGPREGFEGGGVRRLLASRSGALWIGTGGGLLHWSPRDDRIERVDGIGGAVIRDQVNALTEDAEGRLWVGTASGLYTSAPAVARLLRVRNRPDGQDALSHPSVLGLLLDRQGQLWVDTPLGLNRMWRFNGEFAEFENVSAHLGVGGRPFGANLLQDAAGRIWTQKYVFDPTGDSLYQLTRADGADIGTPWFRSYAQTRDGVLLFGGSTGLLVIDPTRFQPWTYAPPVVVTALSIDGVAQSPAKPLAGVTMRPGQRGFSMEFAALDFTAPERNRYQYRLAGYDTDWIQTDADHRVAAYTNLWPGDYTLQVRGSNRTGAVNPHELSVEVHVLPAFWQTAWFAALVLLAASGATYGGFRWRTARIRQHARELKALVEARTAELRSSHDRLQTSKAELETAHMQLTATHTQLESTHSQLASTHTRLVDTQQQLVQQEKMAALGTLTAGVAHEINNPTNFIAGSAQNLESQVREFRRFLHDLAGEDADPDVLAAFDGKLNPQQEQVQNILEGARRIRAIVLDLRAFTRLDEAESKTVPIAEPIQSTINLIRTQFRQIRFDLNLDFNPQIECQPAKLGQVFMNLIVNACEANERVGDSREGVVSMQTRSIANDEVEIAVQDNGCGIAATIRERVFEPFFTTKPVGAGTGLGLAICHGIVREHGGRIAVASTAGVGSRFVVQLPLNAAARVAR